MIEMRWVDIIALSFSLIAIIVSVLAIIRSEKTTKKVTEKTLNTKFFEEVFFDNIIYKLPKSLDDIAYVEREKRITENYLHVNDIVLNILESALFYKYFDNEFYEGVKKILIEIDEKIILLADMKNINKYSYETKKRLIDQDVDKLYSKFKEYYSLI